MKIGGHAGFRFDESVGLQSGHANAKIAWLDRGRFIRGRFFFCCIVIPDIWL